MKSELCVALDLPNKEDCFKVLEQLQGLPVVAKIGMRLLPSFHEKDWKKLREMNFRFFVDAKLHDIPTQVEAAVKAWRDLGASFLTIHLSGGAKMMELAQKATEASALRILGVSVLTSLSNADLQAMKIADGNCNTAVAAWTRLASSVGLKSFVSSVAEVELIREHVAGAFSCCPGIRMKEESVHGDQQRSFTVEEARDRKVNLLVVGRSILNAENSREQSQKILKILER
jgi:orotidine-5'-phosphate decarboxylase